MNIVVKQEECLFLELQYSVGGQNLLTIVDTAEQLWLQCSQDQYAQNQGIQDIPLNWSEVCRKVFLA